MFEYDQTQKHDHRPGVVCPAGNHSPTTTPPTELHVPHVSPAILEFRISELEDKRRELEGVNEALKFQRDVLRRDMDNAKKRIAELEGLVISLAKHIDAMDAETNFVTGKMFNEHAAPTEDAEAA